MCCAPFFHLPAIKQETQFSLSEPAYTAHHANLAHRDGSFLHLDLHACGAVLYWRAPKIDKNAKAVC